MQALDSDEDALIPGDEFVFLLDSGQQPTPASQRCDGEPKQDTKLQNPPLYPSHIQPSQASPDTRIKDDDKGQFNNFYIGDDGPNNTFSSGNSPQPQRMDIQCVTEITLHLPTNQTLQTSALLDTGSVLNFVSKALIEKLGSPEKEGTGREK